MKYKNAVIATFLFGALASAQVASHAPTTVASAASLPAASAQASPLVVTDKPVARVNGAVLTDRDLLREMFNIFPYARQHNGFPKGQEAAIRQGALEMIIFEELVYQEAEHRQLAIPAARLNAAESEFKKQFHSPDEYQQYLQAEMKGSEKNMREQIKRSMLIEQVLKTDVEAKSAVTPAEVQAYYVKNAAKYRQPESYNFQSISIVPPLKPTAEQAKQALKKAQDALQKAKATKELPGFRVAGGKRFRRRFPGEHGRPQSGGTREAAAADREGVCGDAGRTGKRADPDRVGVYDRAPERA